MSRHRLAQPTVRGSCRLWQERIWRRPDVWSGTTSWFAKPSGCPPAWIDQRLRRWQHGSPPSPDFQSPRSRSDTLDTALRV